MDIVEELNQKGADTAAIANEVIENPESVSELIDGVMAPKGTLRYGYEKVLREISEQRPELIYPYFQQFAALLDNKNSFLKWGAILTIANLAEVDSEGQIEKIFRRYYAPVTGPAMVTAANIIGGSVKIISAKPELAQKITREILKVEKAEFERRGEPSPECRNVVLGQAIDAFNQVYDKLEGGTVVLRFVKRQLNNSRPAVVKKAEAFLARHGSTD